MSSSALIQTYNIEKRSGNSFSVPGHAQKSNEESIEPIDPKIDPNRRFGSMGSINLRFIDPIDPK